MILAAKKTVSNNVAARADSREEGSAERVYVEQSPCVVMPALDLSKLIPARFSTPQTILDYLT